MRDKQKAHQQEMIANANVKSKKVQEKQFKIVASHVEQIVKAHDEDEAENVETDCCLCFNLMIESCIMPCRHRFCIQCMRSHMKY